MSSSPEGPLARRAARRRWRAQQMRRAWVCAALAAIAGGCRAPGCSSGGGPSRDAEAADNARGEAGAAPEASAGLPLSGAAEDVVARPSSEEGETVDAGAEPPRLRCAADMVNVGGRFCIDRYEASMVDDATGRTLSPHYPPEPSVAQRIFEKWQKDKSLVGSPEAQTVPLPPLPLIEQKGSFAPRAVSERGVLPQGYLSGRVASESCARAKKRLCKREEWTFACRGERQTRYPYGSEYRPGVCNVFRAEHPAQKLHDNPSLGHSDPRLGLVEGKDGPLLRQTGATRTCASHWGKDAAYDMVGNLDEWIDDPEGTFLGGFFSRSTKEGCDSFVTVHPFTHWDYSTGTRCCR